MGIGCTGPLKSQQLLFFPFSFFGSFGKKEISGQMRLGFFLPGLEIDSQSVTRSLAPFDKTD